MANHLSISLFPSISESDLNKYGITVPQFRAAYLDVNGDMKALKLAEEGDRYYTIVDESNEWDIEKYGIQLTVTHEIMSPAKLFGHAGVADTDAVIGIAVMVISKDSERRTVKRANPEYDLTQASNSIRIDVIIDLKPGHYTGIAHVRSILYVKKASREETGFADRAGFILGDVNRAIVILKGDGSEFPITIVESEDHYLWKLKTFYEDPKTDSFRNNVEIAINRKHPLYSSLVLEGGKKNNVAILEIMSHATQILIEKVISEVGASEIITGRNIEIESVAMAVYNMISTFAKSYENPADLSAEIHNQIMEGEQ